MCQNQKHSLQKIWSLKKITTDKIVRFSLKMYTARHFSEPYTLLQAIFCTYSAIKNLATMPSDLKKKINENNTRSMGFDLFAERAAHRSDAGLLHVFLCNMRITHRTKFFIKTAFKNYAFCGQTNRSDSCSFLADRPLLNSAKLSQYIEVFHIL